MNKQFVVAVTTIAMIASSCVSTPKSSREVASDNSARAIEEIGIQGVSSATGVQPQNMVSAKGKLFDFSVRPWVTRPFNNQDVEQISSGSNINFSEATILTDNDAAFMQKLKVIQSAKKELRLVYFIYANDSSSAVLNSALLEKAKESQMQNIYLLVDLITNYKNLDLFITLNRESKGKIKPYFYNFPSAELIEDVNYITLPCPGNSQPAEQTCRKFKEDQLAKINKNEPTAFAKLFLSGIYGKSAAAMKVAIGLGAQIKPDDFKSKSDKSEEDQEAMLELAKIVLGSLRGNIIDKIKLSIAMAMYGEKITPVLDMLEGRLPVGLKEGKTKTAGMWDHFTDYTHHKLVLADESEMVNGGRNVEDSYHVKNRIKGAGGEKAKYIFMDTDFYGKAKVPNGLKSVKRAFDNIISSTMVKDLKTVEKTFAYEFITNTGATKGTEGSAQAAVNDCMILAAKDASQAADLGKCILKNVENKERGYIDQQSRSAAVLNKMRTGHAAWSSYYSEAKKSMVAPFALSPNDLNSASFHYLENLSTERNNNQERIKGSNLGSESENMKNIQAAWFRSLENACLVSRTEKDNSGQLKYSEQKPLNVIFHSAYLLMPSGMIHRIAQMFNNDFGDCSRVKISFITNSPFTTDLAPINVLARYQLGALFNHYKALVDYKKMFEQEVVEVRGGGDDGPRYVPVTDSTPKYQKRFKFTYKQFWPKLEYYEYVPADEAALAKLPKDEKPNSLHTKTSLIGHDLIVGSANADVRSYYMDTNNAIMIRNAFEVNQQYVNMIEELKQTGRIVEKSSNYIGKTMEVLRKQNEFFLEEGAKRWNQQANLNESRTIFILDNLDEAGRIIYNTTNDLLTHRGILERTASGELIGDASDKVKKLNDKANAMDSIFKVF